MGTRRQPADPARAITHRKLIARTARVWKKINRSLVSSLKEIVQDWLKKILRKAEGEIATGYISEIPDLPKKFTETLKNSLRQALAQGYWLNHIYVQEIRAQSQGKTYHGTITLSDLPDDEDLKEILQGFIRGENSGWNKVIPKDAVNFLDSYVPKLAGNFSVGVLDRTREILRNSMLEGTTLQERMKALRESSDALSRLTSQRIEAIARTEITRADTLGRLTSMKQNDDVIGVEFSAILDDRTTEICSERDGLMMRLDDPRLPENTPPLHVQCRSILAPVTIYDAPDGLLTSHEFEEVVSGMQRPEDIEEVEKILNPETEPETKELTKKRNSTKLCRI